MFNACRFCRANNGLLASKVAFNYLYKKPHVPCSYKMSVDDGRVRVCLRVRPMLDFEKVAGYRSVVTYPQPNTLLIGQDRMFSFDYVKGEHVSQGEVYTDCARPLVNNFLQGYNGTIIAYGQTGSGKTYTMGTSSISDLTTADYGIVPRVVFDLFTHFEQNPQIEYTVKVSFLEIYNEEIKDLLVAPPESTENTATTVQNTPLPLPPSFPTRTPAPAIREASDGSIMVVGAVEEEVSSAEAMLSCIQRGTLNRSTGATLMNSQSSRSHAIFTIHLTQKPRATDGNEGDDVMSLCSTVRCKLHFVDLAGSERLKRTGAIGERMKEGISINCGLLALGNVISALSEASKGGKRSHVPFRDSKITRFLQDSLGGNSKTLMVACLSSAGANEEESVNTAKYASRASNIRNKAVVNADPIGAKIAALTEQGRIYSERVVVLEAMLRSHGMEPPPMPDSHVNVLSHANSTVSGGNTAKSRSFSGISTSSPFSQQSGFADFGTDGTVPFTPLSPSDRPLPTLLHKRAYGDAFLTADKTSVSLGAANAPAYHMQPNTATGNEVSSLSRASSIFPKSFAYSHSYSSQMVRSVQGIVASNRLNTTIKTVCALMQNVQKCPLRAKRLLMAKSNETTGGMSGVSSENPNFTHSGSGNPDLGASVDDIDGVGVIEDNPPVLCTCGYCVDVRADDAVNSVLSLVYDACATEGERETEAMGRARSGDQSSTDASDAAASKAVESTTINSDATNRLNVGVSVGGAMHPSCISACFHEQVMNTLLPRCGVCAHVQERLHMKDTALQEAIRVIKVLLRPKKGEVKDEKREKEEEEEEEEEGEEEEANASMLNTTDVGNTTTPTDTSTAPFGTAHPPSLSTPPSPTADTIAASVAASEGVSDIISLDSAVTVATTTSASGSASEMLRASERGGVKGESHDSVSGAGASVEAARNDDEPAAIAGTNTATTTTMTTTVELESTTTTATTDADTDADKSLLGVDDEVEHVLLEAGSKPLPDFPAAHTANTIAQLTRLENRRHLSELMNLEEDLDVEIVEKQELLRLLYISREESDVERAKLERKILEMRKEIEATEREKVSVVRQLEHVNEKAEAARVSTAYQERLKLLQNKLKIVEKRAREAEIFRIKYMNDEAKIKLLENQVTSAKKEKMKVLKELRKKKEEWRSVTSEQKKELTAMVREKNRLYALLERMKKEKMSALPLRPRRRVGIATGTATGIAAMHNASMAVAGGGNIAGTGNVGGNSGIVTSVVGSTGASVAIIDIATHASSFPVPVGMSSASTLPTGHIHIKPASGVCSELWHAARECVENGVFVSQIYLDVKRLARVIAKTEAELMPIEEAYSQCLESEMSVLETAIEKRQALVRECKNKMLSLSQLATAYRSANNNGDSSGNSDHEPDLVARAIHATADEPLVSDILQYHSSETINNAAAVAGVKTGTGTTGTGADGSGNEEETVDTSQRALSEIAFALQRHNNTWWCGRDTERVLDGVMHTDMMVRECGECAKAVYRQLCVSLLQELAVMRLAAAECIRAYTSAQESHVSVQRGLRSRVEAAESALGEVRGHVGVLREREQGLSGLLAAAVEREKRLKEEREKEKEKERDNTPDVCPSCSAMRKRYMQDTESTKMRAAQTHTHRNTTGTSSGGTSGNTSSGSANASGNNATIATIAELSFGRTNSRISYRSENSGNGSNSAALTARGRQREERELLMKFASSSPVLTAVTAPTDNHDSVSLSLSSTSTTAVPSASAPVPAAAMPVASPASVALSVDVFESMDEATYTPLAPGSAIVPHQSQGNLQHSIDASVSISTRLSAAAGGSSPSTVHDVVGSRASAPVTIGSATDADMSIAPASGTDQVLMQPPRVPALSLEDDDVLTSLPHSQTPRGTARAATPPIADVTAGGGMGAAAGSASSHMSMASLFYTPTASSAASERGASVQLTSHLPFHNGDSRTLATDARAPASLLVDTVRSEHHSRPATTRAASSVAASPRSTPLPSEGPSSSTPRGSAQGFSFSKTPQSTVTSSVPPSPRTRTLRQSKLSASAAATPVNGVASATSTGVNAAPNGNATTASTTTGSAAGTAPSVGSSAGLRRGSTHSSSAEHATHVSVHNRLFSQTTQSALYRNRVQQQQQATQPQQHSATGSHSRAPSSANEGAVRKPREKRRLNSVGPSAAPVSARRAVPSIKTDECDGSPPPPPQTPLEGTSASVLRTGDSISTMAGRASTRSGSRDEKVRQSSVDGYMTGAIMGVKRGSSAEKSGGLGIDTNVDVFQSAFATKTVMPPHLSHTHKPILMPSVANASDDAAAGTCVSDAHAHHSGTLSSLIVRGNTPVSRVDVSVTTNTHPTSVLSRSSPMLTPMHTPIPVTASAPTDGCDAAPARHGAACEPVVGERSSGICDRNLGSVLIVDYDIPPPPPHPQDDSSET